MRDNDNPPLGPGPSLIHQAMQRALELHTTRLLSLAKQNNGGLREADIRGAATDIADDALVQICDETWSVCLATAETMYWSNARKSHFERIMVKCFAQLLPRSDENLDSGRHLSRRIIPGFIKGLHQILGEDDYSRNAERTNTIVDTVRAVHGDAFSWDEVYSDPVCQTVVEDVLIGIAPHFADMAKRRNWMIDVIGAHMPATGNAVEKSWYFGDGAFHTIMNALYGDLRIRLESHGHRIGLEERHGETKINDLTTLFSALEKDHADLVSAKRI